MKPGLTIADLDVDYGQFYLFDADLGMANPEGDDFFADPWLDEHQCGSIGSSAIVLTLAQHGPTRVEVVAVVEAATDAADPQDWDHVVDMSMGIPSGRLAVIGWESTGPVHLLEVAPGDCVVRILWGGLDEAVETNDPGREHLRIEVRPGPSAATKVIRPWARWVPPSYQAVASNGLRLFLGGLATEREKAMTGVNLQFWGHDPETPDGSVSRVLVDPEGGSHFASGQSHDGYAMLRELTDEELAEITAAGDPYRHLFLVDENGHIWNTQMPLRRTPSLQYTPPENFAFIRELGRPEDEPEPLPPGWDRIVRVSLDRPEPVDVDDVGAPEPGVTYQRMRSEQ
jgi:hypothetical protein